MSYYCFRKAVVLEQQDDYVTTRWLHCPGTTKQLPWQLETLLLARSVWSTNQLYTFGVCEIHPRKFPLYAIYILYIVSLAEPKKLNSIKHPFFCLQYSDLFSTLQALGNRDILSHVACIPAISSICRTYIKNVLTVLSFSHLDTAFFTSRWFILRNSVE